MVGTSQRSIQYAATIVIVAAIVVSLFNKGNCITPKKIFEALAAGGQGMITVAAACGVAGIFAVSSALERYFLHHMKWYERIVAVMGGLLLIYPGIVTDVIGLALVTLIVFVQVLTRKQASVQAV